MVAGKRCIVNTSDLVTIIRFIRKNSKVFDKKSLPEISLYISLRKRQQPRSETFATIENRWKLLQKGTDRGGTERVLETAAQNLETGDPEAAHK